MSKDSKDKSDNKDRNNYIPEGAIVAGGASLRSAYRRGELTGRESLYHSTPTKNVDSIKNLGILKRKANDSNTYTRSLHGDSPGFDNKTYFGRSKLIADSVGIARGTESKTMKARVPTWKLNEVRNPEIDRLIESQGYLSEVQPKFVTKLENFAIRHRYGPKNMAVFSDDVGPEFIKGTDKYRRESMKEIGQFIKNKPKQFAKGVGKALGGVGLAAAGANYIRNERKEDKKEKMSKKAESLFVKLSDFSSVITPVIEGIKRDEEFKKAIQKDNPTLAKDIAKRRLSDAYAKEKNKYRAQKDRYARGDTETKEDHKQNIQRDLTGGTLVGAGIGGLMTAPFGRAELGILAGGALGAGAFAGRRALRGPSKVDDPGDFYDEDYYQWALEDIDDESSGLYKHLIYEPMSKKAQHIFTKSARKPAVRNLYDTVTGRTRARVDKAQQPRPGHFTNVSRNWRLEQMGQRADKVQSQVRGAAKGLGVAGILGGTGAAIAWPDPNHEEEYQKILDDRKMSKKAEHVFTKLAFDLQDHGASDGKIKQVHTWSRRGKDHAKSIVSDLDKDRQLSYEVTPGGEGSADLTKGNVKEYQKHVRNLPDKTGLQGTVVRRLRDEEVSELPDETIRNISIRTKRGPIGSTFLGKHKKHDTSDKSREEILELIKKT